MNNQPKTLKKKKKKQGTTHVHIYIYIYIYIEREREREQSLHAPTKSLDFLFVFSGYSLQSYSFKLTPNFLILSTIRQKFLLHHSDWQTNYSEKLINAKVSHISLSKYWCLCVNAHGIQLPRWGIERIILIYCLTLLFLVNSSRLPLRGKSYMVTWQSKGKNQYSLISFLLEFQRGQFSTTSYAIR